MQQARQMVTARATICPLTNQTNNVETFADILQDAKNTDLFQIVTEKLVDTLVGIGLHFKVRTKDDQTLLKSATKKEIGESELYTRGQLEKADYLFISKESDDWQIITYLEDLPKEMES